MSSLFEKRLIFSTFTNCFNNVDNPYEVLGFTSNAIVISTLVLNQKGLYQQGKHCLGKSLLSLIFSTIFIIYMSFVDLVFISHALLRIDELYHYGDFRGGYLLCLSYNSIKTFLMVESILLTTLVAYDRWRLSRFKVNTKICGTSFFLQDFHLEILATENDSTH